MTWSWKKMLHPILETNFFSPKGILFCNKTFQDFFFKIQFCKVKLFGNQMLNKTITLVKIALKKYIYPIFFLKKI
jgi:hypothetical protein